MTEPKHTYPSRHPRGSHWSTDAAWEILDRLKPGVLPDDVRAYLAGAIGGLLMRYTMDGSAVAPQSRPVTGGSEDHRVYFACENCEEHNPEGAVSCRSDIAVMPDGTWLCSGCYSDCEKTAYGLVASDIDDFEFPRFEDMPRPAAYPAGPTLSPQDGRGAVIEEAIRDLKGAARGAEQGHPSRSTAGILYAVADSLSRALALPRAEQGGSK